MSLVSVLYLLLIIVYLAIGAAIIFHLLYYRINRRVALAMCLIYSVGGILLLFSNFTLYRSVNWYQVFSGFGL